VAEPNLDALAKLAPFTVSDNSWDGYEIEGSYRVLEPDGIVAALNDWAELRAYRERTEAALAKLCRQAGNSPNDYEFLSTAELLGAGLWRDPAPKEAKNP
jgi:hypothetical protein